MPRSLPKRPSLESDRKRAKLLLKQWVAGDPVAVQRARTHHPWFARHDAQHSPRAPSLSDAQLVVAREYGFASWPRLKHHIEALTASVGERVRSLVESACVGDVRRAEALLEHDPSLSTACLAAACVAGNASAVLRMLEEDPANARGAAPPLGWQPLVYTCLSRLGAGDAQHVAARLRIVEALLARGADPNAAGTHGDDPQARLPALYGALGQNEHLAVGAALLKAGAKPDDNESVYHAAEHGHFEALRLLKEHGVDLNARASQYGQRPVGFLLWKAQLSAERPTADEGVRWLLENGADPNLPSGDNRETALHRAAAAGRGAEMAELLFSYGADPHARTAAGLTALDIALLAGNTEFVRLLRARLPDVELSRTDRFVAACIAADATTARAMLAEHAGLMQELSAPQLGIINATCLRGSTAALRLMLELDFPVDALGREGETPLHAAAWTGQTDKVALLLQHAPPLELRCASYGSTPLGWTLHGSFACRNPAGNYLQVAEQLIAAGADVHASGNKWGGSLLSAGAPEVADVLRAHGAVD